MSTQRRSFGLVLALAFAVRAGSAQGSRSSNGTGRWKEIGKTSTGNTVQIDPKSVIIAKDGIITAILQMPYAKPYETPQGKVLLSRAKAKFDCLKRQIAVLESTTYRDLAGTQVMQHSAPKIPGFGTVFTSNYSGVALEYLCRK